MSKSEEINFIVDTNVLVDAAFANVGDTRKRSLRSQYFFHEYSQQIVVLDLIWNEFLGAFLHRGIQFNDYSRWFRDRHSVVEQMYKHIIEGKSKYISIKDQKAYRHLFTLAEDFSLASHTSGLIEVISSNILESMEKAMIEAKDQENDYWLKELVKANKKHKKSGKVFDGMDGVLAIYVHLVSKAFPEYKTILVTEDRYLRKGMNICNTEGFVLNQGEKYVGVACSVFDVFKMYGKKKERKKTIKKSKREKDGKREKGESKEGKEGVSVKD